MSKEEDSGKPLEIAIKCDINEKEYIVWEISEKYCTRGSQLEFQILVGMWSNIPSHVLKNYL